MIQTDAKNKKNSLVPDLRATLWLSDKSCAICINPTPAPLSFAWIGRKLFASDRREVILPADDDVSRESLVDRLMAAMKRDRESVFVCEVAPWGPFQEHATSAPVFGATALENGFARLKEFFAADQAINVIAPPKSLQPVSNAEVFISRMAQSLRKVTVAALLVTQMAGAFAGPLQQMHSAAPADNQPVAMQVVKNVASVNPAAAHNINDYFELPQKTAGAPIHPAAVAAVSADMNTISADYLKYAGHGKTGVETVLSGVTASDDGTIVGTAFYSKDLKKCHIAELRVDYSEIVTHLETNAKWGDPALRKFAFAHEDMHCRTSPYMSLSGYRYEDELAAKEEGKLLDVSGRSIASYYTSHLKESMGDAMAILIIARRDGVAEAKNVLAKVAVIRAEDTTGPHADHDHDTSETLRMVSDILDNHPERFASDARAFQTAIEVGVEGANKGFIAKTSAEELPLLRSEAFINVFMENMAGLYQAVEQYSNGNYSPADAKLWMYGKSQDINTKKGMTAQAAQATDRPDITAVMTAVHMAYKDILEKVPATLASNNQDRSVLSETLAGAPAKTASQQTLQSNNLTGSAPLPSLSRYSEPGAAMRMLRQQITKPAPDMTHGEETDAPRG